MKAMPSSIHEKTGSVTRNHDGCGNNNANTGRGAMHTGTGDLYQYEITGNVHFGNKKQRHEIESGFDVYEPGTCDTKCMRYPYDTRPIEGNRIRLLTTAIGGQALGPDRSQTRWSLKTISLDDLNPLTTNDHGAEGGSYWALSYTWNSDGESGEIIVDGYPVTITANLAAFLHEFGTSPEFQRSAGVWIDQLCINQKDNIEKGHQVCMMGVIFAQADTVVIWLGPESDDSALAMSKMASITSEEKFPELEADVWIALEKLLDRSWFKRIWVLQEFKRARKPLFQCGDAYFYWKDIEKPFRAIWSPHRRMELSTTTLEFFSGVARILNLAKLHINLSTVAVDDDEVSQYEILNLVRVMRLYGSNQATIPHDKIYGLLGIANWASLSRQDRPQINYDAPFTQVYTDWARFIISFAKSFDLLYLKQRMLHDESLPSWVPDWRTQREDLPLTLDIFRSTFRYDGLRPELIDAAPYFEENGMLMRAEGFIITTLSSDFDFAEVDVDHLRAMFGSQTFTDVVMACITMGCKLKNVHANDIATIGIAMGRKQVNCPKGRVGLVTEAAQYGDVVCVLGDSAVPFVLRPKGDHYELIGDANIDAFIDWKPVEDLFRPKIQTFKIQ